MSPPLSVYQFQAMGSPCEILFEGISEVEADRLGALAEAEARRIEHKFSRYRQDNIIFEINHSHGKPLALDEESSRLFDFADQLYRLSEGRFDITSGVLRRVWNFDGSDRIASPEAVTALLPLIGWEKVQWQPPVLNLPEGMEVDLGGIGKEYAVDAVFGVLATLTPVPLLVNFGGDLRCRGPRSGGEAWHIGIENPDAEGDALQMLSLKDGGVATSGDARRFLLKDGVRYGHILNPKTGWPVSGAPRSVTVAAGTCTEAGMLSTLAMLAGPDAESFLEAQQVRHQVLR